MARPVLAALAGIAALSIPAFADPGPGAPPPINSSHTPRAPEPAPVAPKPAKPVSAWRKAYVAKHGHEPHGGAVTHKPAPAPGHHAVHAAPHKAPAGPAHRKLRAFKRCT